MKIFITGADGMLGRTLQKHLSTHELYTPAFPDFDLRNRDAVAEVVRSFSPDLVIHCAAMTQVDLCETERELAFAVNADGSRHIAQAAEACGARIIGISTDYVYDGQLDRPYVESDPTRPQTVYGMSKLAGEEAIREICTNWTILRIAWLYGEGGPSFVHTMLRLGEEEGAPLSVVNDQVGNPTSTDAVARVIKQMIDDPVTGMFHCTCEGEATWYEFTKEIFRLKGLKRDVQPCTTSEFPRPAPRPPNSRLENKALADIGFQALPHWKDALSDFLTD